MSIRRFALFASAVAAVLSVAAARLPGRADHARSERGSRVSLQGRQPLPRSALLAVSRRVGADDPSLIATRTGGRLMMANRDHRLAASFGLNGTKIAVQRESLRLKLSAVGYGRRLRPVGAVEPLSRANQVEFHHPGIREWWANGPLGIEQGFSIGRPPGSRHGLLTVQLEVHGSLRSVLSPDRRSVTLESSGGRPLLRYGGLRVSDAHDRTVPAWFKQRGHRLLIRADDSSAKFPLIVDPLVQAVKLSASDGAERDSMGRSVALSGSTVVAGAPGAVVDGQDDQGALYVFSKPAAGWASATETAKLVAGDGQAGDGLGSSVAIRGSTLVAAATGADRQRGALYVFRRSTDGWRPDPDVPKLVTSDRASDDQLGFSLAMAGSIVVAGTPNARVGGITVAGRPEAGNPAQGAVYIFDLAHVTEQRTETIKLVATDGATQAYLGHDVAIDGTTIAAGAPGASRSGESFQGAVYVFEAGAQGWADARQVAELVAGDGRAGDELGTAVDISSSAIVAGAPAAQIGSADDQGAAYAFARPPAGWRDAVGGAKLTASDGAPGDSFGQSVALTGKRALVGSPYATVTARQYGHEGAVYVFDGPASGWIAGHETSKLMANHPQTGFFGESVAAEAGSAVVGAMIASPRGASSAGAAYVFSDDTLTTPIISYLRQSAKRWRLTLRPASIRQRTSIPRGTTFSFVLNVPAQVRLAVSHRKRGRVVRDGGLWIRGHAGRNEVSFGGRLSPSRTLRPGRHHLRVTAKDAAGWSRGRYLHFVVLPARRA